MSELIINKNKEKSSIEIGVLEENNISEFYVYEGKKESIIGNIYCGIVQNVVDGMQAAFVDIGIEKNTFISIKDALPKVDVAKEELVIDKNMSEILKKGDKLLVQVRKEPSEEKGARISTHVTLPGNYIVLMPNTNIITISQKITDENECSRLKKIVGEYLPKGFGAIIRTDAENIAPNVLKVDIKEIEKKWNEIKEKYKEMQEYGIIYDDHDITLKVARDMINQNTEKIYTNDEEIYKKMQEIANIKEKKVEFLNVENIFEKFGIWGKVEKIGDRKVWLKCGGYIAIDKTEALTAIDVNSGKYVGDNNLEQTALSVNTEAATEIMKQIRLKDIGGIVIIDYIDLETKEDQLKIIETMKKEAKKDRSKIDIKGYTKLNLVELTRKKLYM
jgi:ribonuclease G